VIAVFEQESFEISCAKNSSINLKMPPKTYIFITAIFDLKNLEDVMCTFRSTNIRMLDFPPLKEANYSKNYSLKIRGCVNKNIMLRANVVLRSD
jgi:SepF-like predicted cell division protein (DUF552 family)